MSRIGKKPIIIPEGVSITIGDKGIDVKGPKGTVHVPPSPFVTVTNENGSVVCSVKNTDNKEEKAHWGMMRSLINNAVEGVTKEYSKKLEVVGVGYRVQSKGNGLTLNIGFSHPVEYKPSLEGVTLVVTDNFITITGQDKQKVGQIAAEIRLLKKPEPYGGKGIKYSDEVIVRKAGKVAK
jgi:large subunit ribosomal protein L6